MEEKKLIKVVQKKFWCEFCKIDFVDYDFLVMYILNYILFEENEKEKREGLFMIKVLLQFNIWEVLRKFVFYNEFLDLLLDLVRKREILLLSVF